VPAGRSSEFRSPGGMELAPSGEADEDGLFPVGGAAGAYFKVGDHAADGSEQFVIRVRDAVEVVVPGRVGEHERRDALLDGDSAAAILCLVDARVALALAALAGA
jgi:hypothetical protein